MCVCVCVWKACIERFMCLSLVCSVVGPGDACVCSHLHAGISLCCEQISPIIPQNYRESCFPMGVFEWTVRNDLDQDQDVSLMFTFQNGDGNGCVVGCNVCYAYKQLL